MRAGRVSMDRCSEQIQLKRGQFFLSAPRPPGPMMFIMDQTPPPDHSPIPEDSDFSAALRTRYEQLSLLTLDLAQEAGEAVRDFSRVDLGPAKGRFDHGIASMTKAIWAHTVIERLRGGEVPNVSIPHGFDGPGATEINMSDSDEDEIFQDGLHPASLNENYAQQTVAAHVNWDDQSKDSGDCENKNAQIRSGETPIVSNGALEKKLRPPRQFNDPQLDPDPLRANGKIKKTPP